MSTALKAEVKRLSNLKNYKKKSAQEIEKIAQYNIWKKQIDIKKDFFNKEDKEKAENLFNSYLENYDITTYNDAQNVADLVYAEVLKWQTKTNINKITSDETSKFSPDKQIESLHKIEERIWTLKEKLGIGDKKEKDDLTALEELKEKFELYIPFNRNEFTTVCSECGNLQLLRRRCGKEKWENLKHPFFSGRFWFNRRGIELVKSGVWTKEQYAWVFFTSVSYVEWCIEHENEIVNNHFDNIDKEEIEKFIQQSEFLKPQIIPNIIKDEKC